MEVRRPAGVRAGPNAGAEIAVTATLEQLAHALQQHTQTGTDSKAGFLGARLPGRPGAGPGLARARHGDVVHPAVLELLACSGRIRRALLDDHGAVLRLGRSHRLVTPAQRAALLARDGGCVIPGCSVPADRCEIHHVDPWADGGGTDITNLVLACTRHHIEIGDGTW